MSSMAERRVARAHREDGGQREEHRVALRRAEADAGAARRRAVERGELRE